VASKKLQERIVIDSFEFNPKLQQEDFSTSPPAEYIVQRASAKKSREAQENVVLEQLKLLTEAQEKAREADKQSKESGEQEENNN